jgi:hypothetical protein
LAEEPEVTGYSWTADRQRGGDLVHRARPLGEDSQDFATVAVGEHIERIADRGSLRRHSRLDSSAWSPAHDSVNVCPNGSVADAQGRP